MNLRIASRFGTKDLGVCCVELSIRGTFTGPFETPEGITQPTGAELEIPCADFCYVEDGKIKQFNCYASLNIMLAQLGVRPDFASAAGAWLVSDSESTYRYMSRKRLQKLLHLRDSEVQLNALRRTST